MSDSEYSEDDTPIQIQDLNSRGCPPPPGHIPARGNEEPEIAVGNSEQFFEAAFLVKDDQLLGILSELVLESASLKAWFALHLRSVVYRSRVVERPIHEELTKAPEWELVWYTIQQQEVTWAGRYKDSAVQVSEWGVHEPASKIDLWACAMFVLKQHVQNSPDDTAEGVASYTWHEYYYESEGKYFLLYNLLRFVADNCLEDFRDGCESRDNSLLTNERYDNWKEEYGDCIESAVEDFRKREYNQFIFPKNND
jgi:hypothetical protein